MPRAKESTNARTRVSGGELLQPAMSVPEIETLIEELRASGNWFVRFDYDGESYGGFRWNPIGQWTEAPDWNTSPVTYGGLFGQGPGAWGFVKDGTRFCLCQTGAERVHVDVGVAVATDVPIGHERAASDMPPEDAAELMVALLHEVDSRKASLQQSMEREIEAAAKRIRAYYEPEIARQVRRRRWILVQFWQPVSEWAKAKIGDGKDRSVKLLFGSLCLRKTPVRLAVKSDLPTKQTRVMGTIPDAPSDLVMWAMHGMPAAVKVTEEFQISLLPAGVKIGTEEGDLPGHLFEERGGAEEFVIDTGVAKARAQDVIAPEPETVEQAEQPETSSGEDIDHE